MFARPDATVGRISAWYDHDGNIVQITCDSWGPDGELDTTMVAAVGPFDDPGEIADVMVQTLTAQQVLF